MGCGGPACSSAPEAGWVYEVVIVGLYTHIDTHCVSLTHSPSMGLLAGVYLWSHVCHQRAANLCTNYTILYDLYYTILYDLYY